jgi:hypothetical protein
MAFCGPAGDGGRRRAYPNGAEDFMTGPSASRGTFLNYLTWYHATEFKDGDGNQMIPDFDLDVVANVFPLFT